VLLTEQQWTAIAGQPDWEQCTFEYRCGEWKVTRRFVAVRRKQLKEQSPQVDLLDTSEYDYDYFCYVTTESFTPWQTHKKYAERATCETWIEATDAADFAVATFDAMHGKFRSGNCIACTNYQALQSS